MKFRGPRRPPPATVNYDLLTKKQAADLRIHKPAGAQGVADLRPPKQREALKPRDTQDHQLLLCRVKLVRAALSGFHPGRSRHACILRDTYLHRAAKLKLINCRLINNVFYYQLQLIHQKPASDCNTFKCSYSWFTHAHLVLAVQFQTAATIWILHTTSTLSLVDSHNDVLMVTQTHKGVLLMLLGLQIWLQRLIL